MSPLSNTPTSLCIHAPLLRVSDPTSTRLSLTSVDSKLAELRIENSRIPTVTLPSELLSDIFESACHITISTRTDAWVVDRAVSSRSMLLNAILATCLHWREVALTTSSLWEFVLVTNPNYLAADKQSGRIPMLTGMGRAGTKALSLYISRKLDASSWDRTRTLLRPHIHRFRQIFASQKDSSRNSLMDLNSNDEPLALETLVLTWRQVMPSQPEIIDLSRATALRHLHLGVVYQHGALVNIFPPPSSELTHIRLLRRIDPSDGIRIIESTTSLQALRWVFLGNQTPSVDSIKVQPSLRYLSLSGALPTSLLLGLEAPRLETLHIDFQNASLSGLSYITSRAFPHLRTLRISDGAPAQFWQVNFQLDPSRSALSDCDQLERLILSYLLTYELVDFLESDSVPPNITDIWVFVDRPWSLSVRELLYRWSFKAARKDTTLHIQDVPGGEAVVDELMRGLVPIYGDKVTVREAPSDYDRVWTVLTRM